MTAEMKACPFCGGKPHSRTETDLDGFGRFYWFECGGCKARSDEKFATETCSKFYEEVRYAWNRRTDLSQASVVAALEAAAGKCDAIAAFRQKQLDDDEDKHWQDQDAIMKRAWKMSISGLEAAATAIRALTTPDQRTSLQAAIAADVAKARVEDAAKIAQLEQDLADANSGAGDAYCRGYWEGGNGA